uniref:Uncharacterized protein n=1 Tax=Amphimedon queenslandica TaxID=400682 RepID=A0A1X7V818_AMPQE
MSYTSKTPSVSFLIVNRHTRGGRERDISIPNDTFVSSLAWHSKEGWLAVGGNTGLLRVLKLELQAQDKDAKVKGLAAPSTLAMNQTLEAHHAPVVGVTWNDKENKLTTCDQNGLIVVWVLYKNSWAQEMINNRNKSPVSMIQWNEDGQKICIVYEDGAVIVGSVDGNRIWGKELRGATLTLTQWSPDSKILLFGNSQGEILIYDSHGAYNSKMTLHCLANYTGSVKLVSIQWYSGSNGYISSNVPCLAVAFDNGRIQVMRHELDEKPVIINAPVSVKTISWNYNGSILAVAGSQMRTDDKEISIAQFYSPMGKLLYSLRIPGRGLTAVAWEGTGLRIACGVGPYIYFANIRYNYKWAFFANTVVYSYKKPGTLQECVMFWNVEEQELNVKTCQRLILMTSTTDYGLLVTESVTLENQYSLLLCNSLGIPVDTKYLPFEPTFVSLSKTHIVAATGNVLFVWYYRTASRLAAPELNTAVSKALETKDKLFHIDERVTDETGVDFECVRKETVDPISGITASDQLLIVGRMSGSIHTYTLPQLSLVMTFAVQCQPVHLGLNMDSTMLSVVDNGGMFSLYHMSDGSKLALERKEVWGVKWADDNPDLFAIMEKTRMYIFRGLDPEEPVISSASICSFSNLQVKAVLLDELMKTPDTPVAELVVNLDVKSLRDTRQLLEKVGFDDTFQFINDNPHPRLWQLLAESALKSFNFEIARKAFVCCSDYQGIQFVKRLQKLTSKEIVRAEVAAYYDDFDEAERLYIQMDRKDLAIELRVKLGHWFRVLQLLKSDGSLATDVQMAQAWNSIGDYYAERDMWEHALGYYTQASNTELMAKAFFILEKFDSLESLADTLPVNHPLLPDLALKFYNMGMCIPAVSAYLKSGNATAALNCCVDLNQWDKAIQLSKEHGLKDVTQLLRNAVKELLDGGQIIPAIELYRKAGYFLEAAKLINDVAKLAGGQGKLSPLKIKKMYVLSALMVEEYRSSIKTSAPRKKQTNSSGLSSTIQGLLVEDTLGDTALLDKGWRGAEAYHLFVLSQKQFYSKDTESSLKTAMIVQSYSDVLSAVEMYSLVALTGCACQAYSVASQALMKLECSPSLSSSQLEMYEELGVEIFRQHPPRSKTTPLSCPTCDTSLYEWVTPCPGCNSNLVICMGSGSITESDSCWLCPHCKHYTRTDLSCLLATCPLCHFTIT